MKAEFYGCLGGGFGLVFVGARLLETGSYYFRGINLNFSSHKYVAGSTFLLFGIFFIVNSVFVYRKSNK
ncbi:MAG: hypothetical protein M0T70_18460 [Geobacteraceae bacterium]|nr:hypothetical protein [Geobacteraceae bacterium]